MAEGTQARANRLLFLRDAATSVKLPHTDAEKAEAARVKAIRAEEQKRVDDAIREMIRKEKEQDERDRKLRANGPPPEA